MLVLERQLDDRIIMELPDGGRIVVGFSELGATRAKVAVNAPDNVKVFREELEWQDSE